MKSTDLVKCKIIDKIEGISKIKGCYAKNNLGDTEDWTAKEFFSWEFKHRKLWNLQDKECFYRLAEVGVQKLLRGWGFDSKLSLCFDTGVDLRAGDYTIGVRSRPMRNRGYITDQWFWGPNKRNIPAHLYVFCLYDWDTDTLYICEWERYGVIQEWNPVIYQGWTRTYPMGDVTTSLPDTAESLLDALQRPQIVVPKKQTWVDKERDFQKTMEAVGCYFR